MMSYAKILGTGSYLPANCVSNEDLSQQVETSDEWIVTRTGIRQRHIVAEGEQTSDLAAQASLKALQSAGLAPQDIDLIIVATTTPDKTFPSTACIVQQKLGIPGCAAFDVQAVCAGFMYALTTAHAYIQAGLATKALVVGAETFTRLLDWNDRRTCVLFGDGAGAVILGKSETEGGIISAKLKADGNYADILQVPGVIHGGKIVGSPFVSMDGQAVFKFAVKTLTKIGQEVLEEANMTAADIDWVIPHQANLRIIESTAKHLGVSLDKVILTVQDHGNTSAASIPLALDVGVRDGRIQRDDVLLLEGIGGGFAWGAVLLKY